MNVKISRLLIGAVLGSLILGGTITPRLVNDFEDNWIFFFLWFIGGAVLGGYLGFTRKTWKEFDDLYR